MNLQHQVFIGFGSNAGERSVFIAEAIRKIHHRLGTVIRVSGLYESESWGFESDAFYNGALLLHTLLGPEELLDGLLRIETEAGRKRETSGYAARTLDLDILDFDGFVANSERLTLPHRFLPDRKFVLLPMLDIAPDWLHPVTQTGISQLIGSTSDQSVCEKIGELEAPLHKTVLPSIGHLVIEGNIGAGKTTLTRRIAEDFNAKSVLERFADNPFLPKFYEDRARYAFPLEMSFLADRYQQVLEDLGQLDLFSDFIIADYHLYKSLIFARVTLADEEFRLYRKLFDIMYKEVPKPGLYVFLYRETDQLLANIRRRGRDYEQQIPPDYLEEINKGYVEFLKTHTALNILVIDVTGLDFVSRQEDYLNVLGQIEARIASV